MSKIRNDLTGRRFGRLIVIARGYIIPPKHGTYWECRCDCGGAALARSDGLITGKRKSCGCLNSISHETHGLTGTAGTSAAGYHYSSASNGAAAQYASSATGSPASRAACSTNYRAASATGCAACSCRKYHRLVTAHLDNSTRPCGSPPHGHSRDAHPTWLMKHRPHLTNSG